MSRDQKSSPGSGRGSWTTACDEEDVVEEASLEWEEEANESRRCTGRRGGSLSRAWEWRFWWLGGGAAANRMPPPRSDVRFWSEAHRRMDRARAAAVVVVEEEEDAASGNDHGGGDSDEDVDDVVRDPRRRPGLGGASDVCRC